MPHTSRKTKHKSAKRREVTDEEGWTRVTKGSTFRLEAPTSNGDYVREAVLSEDCTVEKITVKYQEIETEWLASDSCKSLMALLEDQVLADDLQIDRCIIFGSGSFSGLVGGWIQRHSTALCQLAVLKTLQRSIGQHTDHRPTAYAQDPCYNSMDKDFLESMNIEVVDSPQGFKLLGNKSLAYSAHAGVTVELEVLNREPTVFITSKLNWYWRTEQGQARTLKDKKEKEESDTRDPDSTDAKQERLEFEERVESECQAFEAFLQSRKHARLPDFEYHGNAPFYNQYLYWHKGSEESAEK